MHRAFNLGVSLTYGFLIHDYIVAHDVHHGYDGGLESDSLSVYENQTFVLICSH